MIFFSSIYNLALRINKMLLSVSLLSVCTNGYLVLSQAGSLSSIGFSVHIQLSSNKINLLKGVLYFIRKAIQK